MLTHRVTKIDKFWKRNEDGRNSVWFSFHSHSSAAVHSNRQRVAVVRQQGCHLPYRLEEEEEHYLWLAITTSC